MRIDRASKIREPKKDTRRTRKRLAMLTPVLSPGNRETAPQLWDLSERCYRISYMTASPNIGGQCRRIMPDISDQLCSCFRLLLSLDSCWARAKEYSSFSSPSIGRIPSSRATDNLWHGRKGPWDHFSHPPPPPIQTGYRRKRALYIGRRNRNRMNEAPLFHLDGPRNEWSFALRRHSSQEVSSSFPCVSCLEHRKEFFPSLLLTIAHAPGGISFTFINELRRRLRPCRGGGGI